MGLLSGFHEPDSGSGQVDRDCRVLCDTARASLRGYAHAVRTHDVGLHAPIGRPSPTLLVDLRMLVEASATGDPGGRRRGVPTATDQSVARTRAPALHWQIVV